MGVRACFPLKSPLVIEDEKKSEWFVFSCTLHLPFTQLSSGIPGSKKDLALLTKWLRDKKEGGVEPGEHSLPHWNVKATEVKFINLVLLQDSKIAMLWQPQNWWMGLPAFTQHLGCPGNQTSDEQQEEIKTALRGFSVTAARKDGALGSQATKLLALGFCCMF
jgi:hypothetical protein